MFHTFPGNAQIQLQLMLHQLQRFFTGVVGKFQNAGDTQQRLVRVVLDRDLGAGALLLEQHLAVILHTGNILVVISNLNHRAFFTGGQVDEDIQILHALLQRAGAEAQLQQTLGFPNMFVSHGLQHFQIAACITAQNAKDGGHIDALEPAGIGNGDTHDILDNVAAAAHVAPLRHPAQNLPALCGGIGNGDGFRAAHGGDQFFLQNTAVCFF